MRRLFLVALALALTPACGGDEAADEEGAEPSVGGAVVDVALSDFAIEPSSLALDPGTYTFHVVNEGATEHALEVEGPTGEETEELGPGESADLTVDLEDGEYEVYCPVGDHRDRGMEGTIAVGGGGGGGTTTDETTTEDEESDYRY